VSHHGGGAMEHLLLSLARLLLLQASRVSAFTAIWIRVILTRFLVLAGVSGSTLLFLWLVGVFRMPFTGVTMLLFFCMVLPLGPLGGAPALVLLFLGPSSRGGAPRSARAFA